MDLTTITELARPASRDEMPPWRPGDAWLAGGSWLFSEPQPSLRRLIDLARLGWPSMERTDEGLRIAATCTLGQLASAEVPPAWRAAELFNQCCRALLGSFKVWNAATVGGNLCMALPAGPMAALVTALDGVCTIWCPDGSERQLPARDFILAPQQNALRPGELLRAIDLSAASLQQRTAFRQISLAPLGRSAALLVGTLASDGGFALTVTASTRRPVRLDFPSLPATRLLSDAVLRLVPAALWYDDHHGEPVWRRHMTLRLAEQIREELAVDTPA
jgi:CO/xanthine dehydrogenase FAD-binding subunit